MYRALIVCNSRYSRDPGALPELQGPKADGILLRDALTDRSAGLFDRSEVRLLPEADSAEIVEAVDEFFSTAEPDDTLLFYYSGHGRNRNRRLYLCAGNTRTDRLPASTLPGSLLSEVIAASFAQVKIVILDCCFSGGFKGDDGLLDELSGEGRYLLAATSATDQAADAAARGEPSPFTRALVDGLLTQAVDRNADRRVDLDDLFTHLSQVRFDGHKPHRKFDGAGAVPIARREPPAEKQALPQPRREQPADAGPAPRHRPRSVFLDDVASGAVLSEQRIEAFRRDLHDDMAATLPQQLTSGEFLQRAGLLTDGRPTLAGVLLFGQNPTALLPSAMVRCVRFRGTRKTDPVESVDLHGTVPELIVMARDFVADSALLGQSPTAASAYSAPAYRYPMIAVREIIANAVVHRDYAEQDACVQVHVFDDRIEVISPGTWSAPSELPDGQVRLSALEGQSQPRNFRLARLLTWVKLVESVGAGLPRSVADCQTVGSPEPVVVIRHGMITVTIFPTAAEERQAAAPARAEAAGPTRSQHLDPGRIAEVLVLSEQGPGRRGSGYRVTNDCVLTAGHVVRGGARITVRLQADRQNEWSAPATVAWVDESADIAVLRFDAPSHAPVVPPVRYGRITSRPAVVTVESAGFPAYKSRHGEFSGPEFSDLAHLFGTASSLSNLRSGTLEITVAAAPSAPSDRSMSPWAGLAGAPVWAEGRIVGVVNVHHSADGPGRLAAARIERVLDGSPESVERLASLLGLRQFAPQEVPAREADRVAPYLDHVRELAPPVLRGRDAELAELAAFCLGDEPYALWQGAPWSGKTALLSSFALRPPADVGVVAFFATLRLAGQADSLAFTDTLIEQLAWSLDETAPSTATMHSGTRDQLRRRLLNRAAARAHADGRRLLLLVDGLDEDRGPQTGLPSIASLLPHRPDDGLRVLVAGRRVALPDDVPAGHPLRTCRVRTLAPSSSARDLPRAASHELFAVLTASTDHQEVIGLLAAGPEGLTRSDLARLTGQAPYRLETMLRSGIGRLLTVSQGEGPAEPRFRFAHEVLRSAAVEQLGRFLMTDYEKRLALSSDQLHQ
ncbi:caspase, EACC1-associated type [Streptomyces naphthomycinicus]|uniref:caspase, EACC1-associated type n=1 Tax=Streptomyces naphthomycinicus TaxID=2872625 RepID=UPI001CED284C|nr:caspase family protein [Streptomyces sp. TML10]